MKSSEVLQKALDLFGPDGECWIKGDYQIEGKHGWWRKVLHIEVCDKFCSIGAIREAMHMGIAENYNAYIKARNYLQEAVPSSSKGDVVGFNDNSLTEWPQVKAMFEEAIAAAKAAGD